MVYRLLDRSQAILLKKLNQPVRCLACAMPLHDFSCRRNLLISFAVYEHFAHLNGRSSL